MPFTMPTLPTEVYTDVPVPQRKARDKRVWTKRPPNPWDAFLLKCEIGSSFVVCNTTTQYIQSRGRRVGVLIVMQREGAFRDHKSRLWIAEKTMKKEKDE